MMQEHKRGDPECNNHGRVVVPMLWREIITTAGSGPSAEASGGRVILARSLHGAWEAQVREVIPGKAIQCHVQQRRWGVLMIVFFDTDVIKAPKPSKAAVGISKHARNDEARVEPRVS